MNKYISFPLVGSIALMVMGMFSCTAPAILQTPAGKPLPAAFTSGKDTLNIATIRWNTFFTDPTLISLIDTALANNFDLKITLQDIEIAKNGGGYVKYNYKGYIYESFVYNFEGSPYIVCSGLFNDPKHIQNRAEMWKRTDRTLLKNANQNQSNTPKKIIK